jgi:uncharacterized protein (TIGR03086 family)
MELLEAYRRGLAEFTGRVAMIGYDQWAAPTPCAGWDVRALVNHVVAEDRWAVPLFAGSTIPEVGDRFAGDLLGADPLAAAREAASQAAEAVAEPGALDRTVQLSVGPTPAREYLHQLLAEHLVHGWDLAVAIGADPRLDPGAVHQCARWFADQQASYRAAGLIATGVPVPADADEQDRLLVAFGRDPAWQAD